MSNKKKSTEQKKHEEIYILISQLAKGLRKHGIKKIISSIKSIVLKDDEEKNYSIVEFIEKCVCEKIGIPNEELFSFKMRGEISLARKICMMLIFKHIKDFSKEQISSHYGRTRITMHNTIREFRQIKLSPKKNKLESDLIKIHDEIDEMVIDFVNKQNTHD